MVGKPIIHAIYLRRNIGNWRGVWANLVRDGKTAFTIPDQEPEELCDKISWLLNDPQLHATMSQRAVEYAQDYAWAKIAKQIVEVYEGLVKK